MVVRLYDAMGFLLVLTQFGFKPGACTLHAIFILRVISELCRRRPGLYSVTLLDVQRKERTHRTAMNEEAARLEERRAARVGRR